MAGTQNANTTLVEVTSEQTAGVRKARQVLAVTVLAALFAIPAASAATTQPWQPVQTKQAVHALVLRGQALNRMYHLGSYAVTSAVDSPDNRAGIRGIGAQSTEMSDVFTRAVARAHTAPTLRPDDRAGIRDIGAQSTDMSDVFTRAVARAGIGSQNADMSDVFTRAVARAHTAPTLRPDDRAGIRGAGSDLAATAPSATTTSESFQWADAGVGAAATLALILVLGGLTAIARSNHQRNHAILH